MLCFNPHMYHIYGVLFYQGKITFPQSSDVRPIFVGEENSASDCSLNYIEMCYTSSLFFTHNCEHWYKRNTQYMNEIRFSN